MASHVIQDRIGKPRFRRTWKERLRHVDELVDDDLWRNSPDKQFRARRPEYGPQDRIDPVDWPSLDERAIGCLVYPGLVIDSP